MFSTSGDGRTDRRRDASVGPHSGPLGDKSQDRRGFARSVPRMPHAQQLSEGYIYIYTSV